MQRSAKKQSKARAAAKEQADVERGKVKQITSEAKHSTSEATRCAVKETKPVQGICKTKQSPPKHGKVRQNIQAVKRHNAKQRDKAKAK